MTVAAFGHFGRVLRRVPAQIVSDARLAADLGSLLRLERTRLWSRRRGTLPVVLAADGARFRVALRLRSSDATVAGETFVGRYHLPPGPLAEVRTVLDLGANIGLTVAHLAVLCPDARVVGVELDRENVALAQRNVAAWADRCSILQGAVWIRDEPVRYRISRGNEYGAAVVAGGELEVEGIAIGTLIARLGWDVVDYVKMDIEGAEQDVLRTNTDWAEHVGSIKVETHGSYRREDCAADLEALGFSVELDERHPSAVAGIRGRAPRARDGGCHRTVPARGMVESDKRAAP